VSKRSNGKNPNRIVGGFVPISYEMLEHRAFKKLSGAAIRVFMHCMKKTNRKDVDRHSVIFSLSYPELKAKTGMLNSTVRRAFKQLHTLGFIDYYAPGGLRKDGKAAKTYQLSRRWKNWPEPHFEHVPEANFLSIQGARKDQKPVLKQNNKQYQNSTVREKA
jgi:hypothetical protein